MSRLIRWLETLLQDARHARRTFRRCPAFVATAVVTLTLGIGASTAIFSVVDSVLLKPVPFAEPDRLVMLMISADGDPVFPVASPAQFMHWKANVDSIEDVAAFTSASFNYADSEAPVRIPAARVSGAYFRVLRAPFTQGRGFAEDEDLPGGGRVAVISHGFWTSYLGASPNTIGSTISLSGEDYTVVGIAAPEFDVRELGAAELWTPLQVSPGTTDQGYLYQVAARLKPGVTLAEARAELEASAAAYRERFPGVLGPRAGFSALTLQHALVGADARVTLVILAVAVGFLLLIACANVANLLLARASGRRAEIAVRAALGAGAVRIARQLLTEGVLLSAAGGALGLVAGFVGIRALLAVDTAGLPRLGEAGALVGMDWRIVAFTVAVSVATGVAFSLAPAFACSRADLVDAINEGGARAGGGVRQRRAHSAFVVLQVGIAVVLLIGAGLLVRTSFALNRVDPGFNAENLLTMRTSLTGPAFSSSAAVNGTVQLTRERLRALPGVTDAVATCCVPLQPGIGLPFNIVGRDDEGLFTGSNAAVFTSPGYFDVFEIPVLRGRAFDDGDDGSGPPVAIINEALASRYWPDGADPLRERMLIGGGAGNLRELADEPVRRIVGIVGNVRATGLDAEPGPIMYVPHAQVPDAFGELLASVRDTAWVVRTRDGAAGVAGAIRDELGRTTGVPVTDVRTMEDVMSLSVSRQRLHMLLMTVFGGSAVVLAAVGVYALLAYLVQQRMREIGIRMALGASGGRVGKMIVGRGMALASLGLVLGLLSAYFVATLLSTALFGVDPHDPAVFVSAAVGMAAACLAATAIPAAKAGRADPLASLRAD